MIETSGKIEINGETIKWNRVSNTGLAIEFSYKDALNCGGRLHIGYEGNIDDIEAAKPIIKMIIKFYRQGYYQGLAMGKEHIKAEFKKLMGDL
jgi:hypothetical protein